MKDTQLKLSKSASPTTAAVASGNGNQIVCRTPRIRHREPKTMNNTTNALERLSCIRLVRHCGWTLHRWATLRCGKCSDRMFGFWCWVLDRLESVFGEPPENAAFHALVDVWCEMDHNDDEDAPNKKISDG